MRQISKIGALRYIVHKLDRATSNDLRANFRQISGDQAEHLSKFFWEKFTQGQRHPDPDKDRAIKEYWSSPAGQHGLNEHVLGRLDRDRLEYVPWLNAARALRGSRILEIGSGTGASSVALAEQGAEVVGVDVEDIAIDMAEERARVYGLSNTKFLKMNAVDLRKIFSNGEFDFIILFAALEHMTYKERLGILADTWDMLSIGGLLCVVEAPNRLWYFDDHTSNLPFFHWLPDPIASLYLAQRDGRAVGLSTDWSDSDTHTEFMRLGRGVSYHEFELALGPLSKIPIVSDRYTFQNSQNVARLLYFSASNKGRYHRFLRRVTPEVPPGFLMPYLNLILRKR